MKKIVSWALLMVMVLSIFSGCGKEKEQKKTSMEPTELEIQASENQTTPEVIQTDLEKVMGQENHVDDSFTFSRADRQNDGYRTLNDYMADQVYPAYLEKWTENGEYVKSSLSVQSYQEGGYTLVCWILFRGIPKEETGWMSVDGKELYCRSFFGESSDGINFSMGKSQAGIPVDHLSNRTFFGTPAGIFGLNDAPTIPARLKIQKAELYIRSLGKSFVLEDFGKLQRLTKEIQPWKQNMGQLSHRSQGWNPMVITLEDGSLFLIYTMDDGFPQVDAWGGISLDLNLWQMFGVPEEAAGFETDDQGNSVLTLDNVMKTYTPDGRILRETQNKTMEDGLLHTVHREYTYRDDLLVEKVTVRDGEKVMMYDTYEYDSQGLLIKKCSYSDGALGWFMTYEYDNQGRITAEIWHKADGSLGHKTSNNYYWYDEIGNQYRYGMLDDGTINSGKAPPTPVRK